MDVSFNTRKKDKIKEISSLTFGHKYSALNSNESIFVYTTYISKQREKSLQLLIATPLPFVENQIMYEIYTVLKHFNYCECILVLNF